MTPENLRAAFASIVADCERDVLIDPSELNSVCKVIFGAWSLCIAVGVEAEAPTRFRARMEARIRRAA